MNDSASRDATRLANALAAWLLRRQPDIADVAVSNLRSPAQGYSNETQLLDVSWTRAGRAETLPFVIRFQSASDEPGTFPDNDIATQYRCLEALQDTGIPLPGPMGFEADPAVLGAPFYLMSRVEGRVPNENPPYHLQGWLHELAPDQRADLWLQGIDTAAIIGRVTPENCDLRFLERPQLGSNPRDQILEYYRRHMLWAEALHRPYPHLHRAWNWLDAHRPADQPVALCWGDAKLGNSVYRDGRLMAALDWEGAHLGDPVMDLAWWMTIDRCLSEGYGFPRLAGLPGRSVSIARWEAAMGRPAGNIEYWEVFSAFKLASIMARIGTTYQKRGMVPAEMEMDINNGAAVVLATFGRELGFEERP
jgi:aminoglycoside phosphotransferase (APT) family kinase protein